MATEPWVPSTPLTEIGLAGLVYEAVGAASTCWDEDGIFEDRKAVAIANTVISYVTEYYEEKDRSNG